MILKISMKLSLKLRAMEKWNGPNFHAQHQMVKTDKKQQWRERCNRWKINERMTFTSDCTEISKTGFSISSSRGWYQVLINRHHRYACVYRERHFFILFILFFLLKNVFEFHSPIEVGSRRVRMSHMDAKMCMHFHYQI